MNLPHIFAEKVSGFSPAQARKLDENFGALFTRSGASAPLSNRMSIRAHNDTYASSGGTGQTISQLHQLPAPPSWVRFIYFNDQGSTWPIDGAAFACTSKIGDGRSAYNAAGNADTTLWVPMTFNSAGADVDPEVQASGSTVTRTVPANTAPAGQPVLDYSDWMQCSPLARIDGGSGYLIQARTYSAGNVRYATGGAPDASLGISYASYWESGNKAASPFADLTNAFGFSTPYGVQFLTDARAVTVLGVGDSIMLGSGGAGANASGLGIRACQLLNSATFPLAYVSAGYSGRTSVDFCADGINEITATKPQIVLVQAWSRNDQSSGNTQATADGCYSRCMAVVDYAIRRGAYPIVLTANPCYSGDATSEAFRNSNNQRVRAAAARGLSILDIDAIWGTGAAPNAFKAVYDSGDHVHPNAAGYLAAAQVLAPIIASAIRAP